MIDSIFFCCVLREVAVGCLLLFRLFYNYNVSRLKIKVPLMWLEFAHFHFNEIMNGSMDSKVASKSRINMFLQVEGSIMLTMRRWLCTKGKKIKHLNIWRNLNENNTCCSYQISLLKETEDSTIKSKKEICNHHHHQASYSLPGTYIYIYIFYRNVNWLNKNQHNHCRELVEIKTGENWQCHDDNFSF